MNMVAELERRVGALERKFKVLREEVSELSGRITSLESAVARLRAADPSPGVIEELRRDIEGLKLRFRPIG